MPINSRRAWLDQANPGNPRRRAQAEKRYAAGVAAIGIGDFKALVRWFRQAYKALKES